MNVIPKGLQTSPQDYFEFYRFLYLELMTLPLVFWSIPFEVLTNDDDDLLKPSSNQINKTKNKTK